jgi:branched-chain amino acid transport system permease protein
MTVVWTGLALGGIYALVAVGYDLTLNSAGVVNFANANFLVLGAFIGYWGIVTHGWPFIPVCLIAMCICAAGAVIEEQTAIRFLVPGAHGELVTTVGFASIVSGVIIVIWGAETKQVPFMAGRTWEWLGGRLLPVEFALFGLAVVIAVLLHLATKRTQTGLRSLARAESVEIAMVRGVNVRRLSILAFALSGALAGFCGPLVGARLFADISVALALALKGFVALVLGGPQNYLGSLAGGLIVGLCEAGAARWLGAQYQNLAVFLLFAAVLLIRPQGVFGTKSTRTV